MSNFISPIPSILQTEFPQKILAQTTGRRLLRSRQPVAQCCTGYWLAGIDKNEQMIQSQSVRGRIKPSRCGLRSSTTLRMMNTARSSNVNLIVGTTHNNAPINMSVKQAAMSLIKGGVYDQGLLNKVEMTIRAYDPCLSCQTSLITEEVQPGLSAAVQAAVPGMCDLIMKLKRNCDSCRPVPVMPA